MGMKTLLVSILLLCWQWKRYKADSHTTMSLTVAGLCTHWGPVLLGLFSIPTLHWDSMPGDELAMLTLFVLLSRAGTWSSWDGALSLLSFVTSMSVCKAPTPCSEGRMAT